MFSCLRLSLGLLLLHLTTAHVFLDEQAASQVLIRRIRANHFFEEVKKGNHERECVEERCSWEEAREIFEDKEKTNEFWAVYVDGDACKSNPCAHGGQCKDGIGSYACYCQEGYKGFRCEIVIPELCENKNGGCEHFCNVDGGNVRCSCADGYFLAPDDKSCMSNKPFKCGAIVSDSVRTIFRYERQNVSETNVTELKAVTNSTEAKQELLDPSSPANTSQIRSDDFIFENKIVPQRATQTRIVNGEDCPPGQCPWQALILNEDNQGFCGGTILNEYIILTAAHCMNQSHYISVRLGEFDTLVNEGTESMHEVDAIISHFNYKPVTYHNDIALIKLATPIKFSNFILPACIPEMDFAEKVLMRQPEGLVSGFGRLGEGRQASTTMQRLSVPYVDRHTCMESTQLRITTRMFCAGYDTIAKDACQGDSGGPHVTRYHDTYFITGIVSWGEGCARKGKYGVYTQVSKYIQWIHNGINTLMSTGKSSRRKRHHGNITRLYL
ncbi:coagulation factor X [Nematolebias whitei]|uniref:coagulation factor X n=1 Tax=Nematolebias whitei TaxID=451745 RepID=UPI001897DD99|nr:coagulation factor X [Nematolebias whitei]